MGNVIYHTYKTVRLGAVISLAFTSASMDSNWHLAAIKINSVNNPNPTRGTGVPYSLRIVFLISAAIMANFFLNYKFCMSRSKVRN
jgi:hypothetical protein